MKTILGVLFLVSGCTSTVGPLVTNISYAGNNRIVVEKCMVELNRMISTVSQSDCKTHEIAVGETVSQPVASQQKSPQ